MAERKKEKKERGRSLGSRREKEERAILASKQPPG